MTRITAHVDGQVQGVGFRWWVRGQSVDLNLDGSAENLPDGRVRIVAEGTRDSVQALLERLEAQPSAHRRPGQVTSVSWVWEDPLGEQGFLVR